MAIIPGYVKAISRKTPFPDRRSAKADRLSPVAALVQRHDRDRYQTVLFAPVARREALFALYAFNYEIARVRERVTEPILGRMRLEWWREVVTAAFDGGLIRHHVVVESLTAAIREYPLTRAHFDRLIDTRENDLLDEPLASLKALEDYAEGTSARLVYLALEILGARDPPTTLAGFHAGIGYALAGLLHAMPYLALTGRRFIPTDIAARTGFDDADYRSLRARPALRAASAELAAAASRHLASARSHRATIARSVLSALLPATIARRSLTRLRRAGYDPFEPSLTTRDPLQSWRLAIAMLLGRF
jgi:NADH dehydrogenase [ubiquinone] 1 alpha subcomplex assembly factor 6